MNPLTAYLDGISLWAPILPGWGCARAVLRGEAPPADPPHPIPLPAQVPRAERRRTPQTAALSLAAADEATHASGHDPASLLAVFASAHGDLPVIDTLCRTLVHTPTQVSPTRFLHSIHNAPAGQWSMLARNGLANTAVSGAAHSFAHGLLEALVQCAAEQRPVLFVAYDTAAVGALTHTTTSQGALAAALVLSPRPGPNTRARLDWRLSPGEATNPVPKCPATLALQRNAMAPALPLFEALSQAGPARLGWPLSRHQSLLLDITA
jgi:Beta-ketoacyl synthase, N-terminal domain